MRGLLALMLIWLAMPIAAQDFTALARIDPAQSALRDAGPNMVLELQLSQPVPYRVFTVDAPRRLVIDFREVDWTGLSKLALLNSDLAADLRFGTLRPGWSRMVIDLAAPVAVREAGMVVDTETGFARLKIVAVPADADSFAATAGAPSDPGWDALMAQTLAEEPQTTDGGPVVIAIDPGHGGIDPGAERDGVQEAALMLQLAIELADAINRTEGLRAVLTRQGDDFVPLEMRMTIARAAHAKLLISLHADALEEDDARGASIYTLSADALDGASQRMAERHERGDLLAGLDLSGQADRVATVLMDLARLQTVPASTRFADTLVGAMRDAGARMNSRPRREGQLAVLNAADFASVLIEVGFLSNDQDRDTLLSPETRAPIVQGIAAAVQAWVADEAARAPLIRQ